MSNHSLIERYLNSETNAEKLAEETLAFIHNLKLAPNPVHYTLLYEYIGEIDPITKEEILTAIQLHAYDDETAAEIYEQLLHRLVSQHLPLDDAEQLLQDFQEKTEHWQESLHEEQQTLHKEIKRLTEQLNQPNIATEALEKTILPHLQAIENNAKSFMEAVNLFIHQFERMRLRFSSEHNAARTDPLSGLLNRRGLMEKLQQIILNAKENGQTFSMIIMDIDYFKKINDEYGHVVGDSVIRYLARMLKNETKGQDVVARLGGEEFVIILPQTPYDNALLLAEKLRQKVEKKLLSVRFKNQPLRFTFSAGVAVYQLDEPIEALFERADQALYKAKALGRNRVVGEDAL